MIGQRGGGYLGNEKARINYRGHIYDDYRQAGGSPGG